MSFSSKVRKAKSLNPHSGTLYRDVSLKVFRSSSSGALKAPAIGKVATRPDRTHPDGLRIRARPNQLLMSADQVFSISLTTGSGIGM